MTTRSHVVRLEAEVSKYTAGMAKSKGATKEVLDTAEALGKAVDEVFEKKGGGKQAKELADLAAAHQKAAKAAGLQYNASGELVDANGRVLSSAKASAHGLDAFSEAVYKTSFETEQAAAAAEKMAAKHKAASEEIGRTAAITGAAIMAGVAVAVKAYADFDKQMSSVQASTHESAGNMKLLRDAAVEAGADTAFSAVEAAQGIEELAKAGVSTKDIMGGGLKGSLDLAAAGNLSVAESAEISASALTQFKLSGDKIPHLADLLAAGAGKAQGSVHDLGEALNQSGLVAASTGLTIEETTGSLAAFAAAGLTGSDAGTSFKTMLMSLNPNSAAAASLMNQLGISAYDAQGKFVGMSEYAGILQDALKGMSDEQRNATLKTIFGSDAVRAANVLYEQGADGINKWEAAVNDAGYAAETASIMQDNLAGDIERLGGSIDSVFLKSGSGANDYLRDLAQGAEEAVDWIGQLDPKALSAAATVAGLVGVAALAGGAFITVVPKIRDTRDALNDLAPAGGRARDALGKVAKAGELLGALTVGTMILAKLAEADYMSKIDEGMGRVANVLADVAHNSPGAAAGLDSLFKNKDGEALIRDVDSLDSALKRTFRPDADRQFNDWGESVINSMTGVKGSSQILGDSFKRVDETMAQLVSSGKAEDAAKVFDRLRKSADAQGISVDELKKKFPQYADALQKADAESKNAAASGDKAAGAIGGVNDKAAVAKQSAEDLAKALEDVGLSADGSVTDIDKFAKSLFNAGLLHLSASDATIAYQAAIDAVTDSIKENGKSLDDNEPKGRANLSAYNDLAKAAMATAEATAAETLASQGSAAAQDSLQASLQASYNDLITAAGQFGITGDAADDMARKALGIPKEVPITTWVNDSASAKLESIKGKADALDGRVVNLSVVEQYTRFISEKKNPTEADLNGDTFRPGGTLTVPGLTRANGGDLDMAPGPKGVDSQLFWGAKGEHVLTDQEVDLMGGQDAVYKFRADLRAGKIRGHAGGGELGRPVGTIGSIAAPAQFGGGNATNISLSFTVKGETNPRETVQMLMGEVKYELSKAGVKLGG